MVAFFVKDACKIFFIVYNIIDLVPFMSNVNYFVLWKRKKTN